MMPTFPASGRGNGLLARIPSLLHLRGLSAQAFRYWRRKNRTSGASEKGGQMGILRQALAVALGLANMALAVRAEVTELVLGQQFGAVYLPAMVMEREKLV